MTEIITDEYDIEVTIIEHSKLQIIHVTAPDCIEENEEFTVEYEVKNDGETEYCFGRIIDSATGFEVPGTRWEEKIPSGGIIKKSVRIHGQDVVHTLKIEVGYLKYDEPVKK
jgi:hypothetical protein